ncbi:DNA cytosine methyltransferase [Sulfurovum sp. CS9]|uniref:DNA cytosine methyltransferase n=1 Tax=Sulfurovum sp. CS9 TaxID=3391146 RepID=UPI0039EC1E4C
MKNTNPTAQETKMFSYSGSKLKYKEHFEEAHNKAQVKNVHTYIEALLSSLNTITAPAPVNNVAYNNTVSQTLKCATAFSGIGAAEEALKNLGVNHKNEFIVEIDKFARETFQANHEVKKVFTDITKIDPKNVPDIDLFIFGSPCQSYSYQGGKLGLEDTRGTLVYNGLQIVKEKEPKYFIYENVKGMVTHDRGNTFAVIKAAFEELNYTIQYEVLNAKHYGAAQNRERLFIVGIRKDIKEEFTFPKPQAVSKTVNYFISNTPTDYTNYTYPSEGAVAYKTKRETDIKKVFMLPHLRYESDSRIHSTNGISPCILAGGKVKFYDEKNKLFRYLNEQELKELQGFNKNFKFPVSNTQAKKQIGNSIFVGVLEAILANLIPSPYKQEETPALAA